MFPRRVRACWSPSPSSATASACCCSCGRGHHQAAHSVHLAARHRHGGGRRERRGAGPADARRVRLGHGAHVGGHPDADPVRRHARGGKRAHLGDRHGAQRAAHRDPAVQDVRRGRRPARQLARRLRRRRGPHGGDDRHALPAATRPAAGDRDELRRPAARGAQPGAHPVGAALAQPDRRVLRSARSARSGPRSRSCSPGPRTTSTSWRSGCSRSRARPARCYPRSAAGTSTRAPGSAGPPPASRRARCSPPTG